MGQTHVRYVGTDDRDGVTETLTQPLGAPAVQFHGEHACPGGDQMAGQRAMTGSDVHNEITVPHTGVSDDNRRPLVNERMPAPRSPGPRCRGHGAPSRTSTSGEATST
jgi:hypothetical protein